MKVLTKAEEAAHYQATIKGGTIGGLVGTAAGGLGAALASQRYPAFRALTLPFRVFLVASTGTFAAVIAADRASNAFDFEHSPAKQQELERERHREEVRDSGKTTLQRAKEWGETNRYSLVFGFWVASMVGSFAFVSRQPLSASQKLVQARVYAQGSTLAVLLASFAFEASDAQKGKGRWETIKVLDPNDPTHKHYIEKKIHHERYHGEDQWREMVEAEEARINARKDAAKAQAKEEESKNKATESKKKDNGKAKEEGKNSSDDKKQEAL